MRLATLPMYDWPEVRAETAALWSAIRAGVLARLPGCDLPLDLTPTPTAGPMALWCDPGLVFGQTCWGPLSLGLINRLLPLAQPDYTAFTGGRGAFYRSALVARAGAAAKVPTGAGALLPVGLLAGRVFALNSRNSLSGYLGLRKDLGADPGALAARCVETGSHRASIMAVAEGRADLAAIDCRSWALARRHEPCAKALVVVGWSAERWGLPYVTSRATDPQTAQALRETLITLGCHAAPARSDL